MTCNGLDLHLTCERLAHWHGFGHDLQTSIDKTWVLGGVDIKFWFLRKQWTWMTVD